MRERLSFESRIQLSLLASTPDIVTTGYMVNLLLGTPDLLASESKALGFDDIEFFPGPPGTVGVAEMDQALRSYDVTLTAVNSGRIVAEGLTLLHPDPGIRARAMARFGAAVGSPLLLAPTDEADSNFICTVAEAMAWVRRINHPALGLMLDTYHLARKESSVAEGLRAAAGLIRHLHLHDPGRMPPGTQAKPGLDWPAIMAALNDIGYEGAASVCLPPSGDRRALAIRAVTYLRSLMPA
jgi:sugar phosphate isomerase/epimerase